MYAELKRIAEKYGATTYRTFADIVAIPVSRMGHYRCYCIDNGCLWYIGTVRNVKGIDRQVGQAV